MLIMPTVNEQHVQGKLQFLLNSTHVIDNQNEKAITKLNHNIHEFAELKVSEAITWILVIFMFEALRNHVTLVLEKSTRSKTHIIQGLGPVFVLFLYQVSVFNFSEYARQNPALIIFMVAPFFTCQCSRLIVNSVSKSDFNFSDHWHLHIPVYLAILTFPLNSILQLGLNDHLIIFVLTALGMFNSYWFTTNTIAQITEALDIYCLTMKRQIVFVIEDENAAKKKA